MNVLSRLRTAQWRTPPTEAALAAVVTAVMAADVGQAAHPFLVLALVLMVGPTLAWRLRVPELPLFAACLVYLYAEATAPGQFGPQTLYIGVLVALYSAAAHLGGRRAWIAGAGSLVLVWVASVAGPEVDVADFWPFVIWGAPWLVGRLARRQSLQARADGVRAAVLLAEQEAQTRDAASRERDRIARELHDVVAHSVSLMVVQAGAERLSHPDSPSRPALESIETAGRQALVELRTMLGVLRSPDDADVRDPQPDLASLASLVEQVRAAGLPVELHVTGDRAVPAGIALAAYRIVQEALTNALRHAGAVPTTVELEVSVNELCVEVRSRLRGSAAASIGSGRGVVGMRERVALHDGALDAGPEGDCWVVRARLPLPVLVT
ncbi:MAG: sensor histidine kinase [Frankiaceae bacterium]|nr:sensor histidine kinase [Frankiaceae bacterium]